VEKWEGGDGHCCRLLVGMKGQKTRKTSVSHRASVSFPPDLCETLEAIAQQKKVSLAWVVREAAERYVAEQWPLFAMEDRGRYERHR
jgi:hypothetical protein